MRNCGSDFLGAVLFKVVWELQNQELLVTTRQHPMSKKHDVFLTHGGPPTPGNPSTVPLRRCYGDSTASRVPTIFVLTWTWSLSLMTVSLARFLATVFFVRFFARFFRFLASLPAFVWQLQHQEILKEKEFLWARTLRLACISTDVKISLRGNDSYSTKKFWKKKNFP